MSRSPVVDEEALQSCLALAEVNGYDLSKITRVEHTGNAAASPGAPGPAEAIEGAAAEPEG